MSVDADSAVVLGEKDKMAVQHLCWVEAVSIIDLMMLFTLWLSEDAALSVDDSAVVLDEKDMMAIQHLCWVEEVSNRLVMLFTLQPSEGSPV